MIKMSIGKTKMVVTMEIVTKDVFKKLKSKISEGIALEVLNLKDKVIIISCTFYKHNSK